MNPSVAIVVLIVSVSIAAVLFSERSSAIERFADRYLAASDEERERIAEEHLKVYSPGVLLEALEGRDSLCHSAAHPVGRVIFRRSGNITDAMRQCQQACSYGCFHGALMELFSTNSDTLGGRLSEEGNGALDEIADEASKFCFSDDVARVVLLRECIHGIGHVVTYAADYDLSKAVASCARLKRAGLSDVCAAGAFMEFIQRAEYRPTVSQKNFYPCDLFPQQARGCYAFKGRFMLEAWGTFDAAVGACQTLATMPERIGCIRGLGIAIGMRTELSRPDALDGTCGELAEGERTACIEGAVSATVLRMDDGDSDPCLTMAPFFRDLCLLLHRERISSTNWLL